MNDAKIDQIHQWAVDAEIALKHAKALPPKDLPAEKTNYERGRRNALADVLALLTGSKPDLRTDAERDPRWTAGE